MKVLRGIVAWFRPSAAPTYYNATYDSLGRLLHYSRTLTAEDRSERRQPAAPRAGRDRGYRIPEVRW